MIFLSNVVKLTFKPVRNSVDSVKIESGSACGPRWRHCRKWARVGHMLPSATCSFGEWLRSKKGVCILCKLIRQTRFNTSKENSADKSGEQGSCNTLQSGEPQKMSKSPESRGLWKLPVVTELLVVACLQIRHKKHRE